MDDTISSSRSAFDAAASGYDAAFSSAASPLVALLRARVHQAIARHFPPGGRLLELGCGTGEDALALTRRGYRVIATDPAPGMIATARAKLAAAGQLDRVTFVEAGAGALAARWPSLGLAADGVFSSFGPLNCELSLAPVSHLLEAVLPPGGRCLAVVMPRLAPSEIASFLLRGRPGAALRRFRRDPIADVAGHRFPIRYYGPGDFDRALGGAFRRIETRALGLVLPPPPAGPIVRRLLPHLARLEDVLAPLPLLRRMGDHVLVVYERR